MVNLAFLSLTILTLHLGGCGQHSSVNRSSSRTADVFSGGPKTDPVEIMADAIARGDRERVTQLLDGGLAVDSVLPNGRPLVTEATLQIQIGVLADLVRRGADVERADRDGRTALDHAREREILRAWILLDPGRQESERREFMKFMGRGSSERVDSLLRQSGVDPNFVDDSGDTPLILGIKRRRALAVEVLANWKDPYGITSVDLNLAGRDGQKPLAVARQTGQQRIVDLLSGLGAQE